MSKPEDIPQDVRAKAAAAGSALRVSLFELNTGASKLWGSPGVIEDMNLHFARAILAAKAEEREACALIANDYRDHPSELAAFIGDEIAAAIRKRGEPKP